jgi:hypothetical protein
LRPVLMQRCGVGQNRFNLREPEQNRGVMEGAPLAFPFAGCVGLNLE